MSFWSRKQSDVDTHQTDRRPEEHIPEIHDDGIDPSATAANLLMREVIENKYTVPAYLLTGEKDEYPLFLTNTVGLETYIKNNYSCTTEGLGSEVIQDFTRQRIVDIVRMATAISKSADTLFSSMEVSEIERLMPQQYEAWLALQEARSAIMTDRVDSNVDSYIKAHALFIGMFLGDATRRVQAGEPISRFRVGRRGAALLVLLAGFLTACGAQVSAGGNLYSKEASIPTRTPAPALTHDKVASQTATNTQTPTSTSTPTATATATNTHTPTSTPTQTTTNTPTPTFTPTWLPPVANTCEVDGVRGISGPEIMIPQGTEINRYFIPEYRVDGVTYRVSINMTNGQDRTAPINFRTNGEAPAEHAGVPLVFDQDTCVYLNGSHVRVIEAENGEIAYTPYLRLVVKNEAGQYMEYYVAASDLLPFLDENTLIMALGPLAIAWKPTGPIQDSNGDTYFGVERSPGNVSAHQWNVDDPFEFRVINEDSSPLLGTAQITDENILSWLTEGQLVLVTHRSVQSYSVYEVVNNGDQLELRLLPTIPGWGEKLAEWQHELMQQPQEDEPSQLEEADAGY
ncbi:MAG: hypothetical protein QY318_03250 [Candidatus Dojkabacteria bacterium]|nr:MAG: hypothetical protein QY318_03250 [Candidatus Dojkabacteria bacterium]